MKKKRNMLRCLKLACLIVCVALLSWAANVLCKTYDYNSLKMEGFYAEPENSLDVVLMGASDVFTGYSAAYAYDLYGFTSYPYALDATPGSLYRSQLREILKHQDPKLILVEINGVLYDDPVLQTHDAGLLRYIHNIPFSWNKVRTVMELVPRENWYYYLFPLAKSHSDWKKIPDQLDQLQYHNWVSRNGSVLKGNVTMIHAFEAPAHRDVSQDMSTAPLEPESEKHLRAFLDFCREEGLDNVLFVRFPHIVGSDWNYNRFRQCNEAERIIVEEYGYPFVNLERDYAQIGLDYSQDFYNEDHVTVEGQKKLTQCLSRILVEEYGIGESQLTDVQRENWETAAEYYGLFYDYARSLPRTEEYVTLAEDRELMEILNARKQEK